MKDCERNKHFIKERIKGTYSSLRNVVTKRVLFNHKDLTELLSLSLEEGNITAARVYAHDLGLPLSKKNIESLLRVNLRLGNVTAAKNILRELGKEDFSQLERLELVRGAILFGKIVELCKITQAVGASGKAYIHTCLTISAARFIRYGKKETQSNSVNLHTWDRTYCDELRLLGISGKVFPTPVFPEDLFWILPNNDMVWRVMAVLIAHNALSEEEIRHILGKQ